MRWREVIHDINTMLQQTYDDADISLTQTAYWCSVIGNRLLMQHIEKKDSGAFVVKYSNISILTESDTNYKYIELPHNIFDLDKDDGVEYLTYHSSIDTLPPFSSVKFTRTSASGVLRLYWTEEEKPSTTNPYFWRSGDKLYLIGIEDLIITNLEGAFYQTIDPYPTTLNDDFPFPDELISVLQRYIFDLGRFVLQMPKDDVNDGKGMDIIGDMRKMTPVTNDVSQQQE